MLVKSAIKNPSEDGFFYKWLICGFRLEAVFRCYTKFVVIIVAYFTKTNSTFQAHLLVNEFTSTDPELIGICRAKIFTCVIYTNTECLIDKVVCCQIVFI